MMSKKIHFLGSQQAHTTKFKVQTMNDIAFIVDTLNRPPFEKKLTIVDFANKNSVELLQIINDVFALIDENQR